MQIDHFSIKGPLLLTPRVLSDRRGYFLETFKASAFENYVGQDIRFVQDNQSASHKKGTVRGLHYQSPPHAQGKLVRCVKGAIIDVAVDVRKNSDTYGDYVKVELSEQNAAQLWVPVGFLHGFLTQEDDTIVAYKCTDYFHPESEGSVLWNDPTLAIDWGIDADQAFLSDKDIQAPGFDKFTTPFMNKNANS